ncbi:hypothetical protein MLD38_002515 [Melastoma candidum]|uniref:Uncharacterized protein n=1 Tax=Melastoma candidum TaxID=119954 RepID=A0ACB9RYU6_9MYRT|nr:hypothetical protein MLD38_002515 [Melastoma candidum]
MCPFEDFPTSPVLIDSTTSPMARLSFTLLVAALASFSLATASDPDLLTDFIAPANQQVPGSFFKYSKMRPLTDDNVAFPKEFTATKASLAEFPALNGQSVSLAVLQYPAGTVNPPHTHPRSAELLFVTSGTLFVGFIDTTNKLYTETLQAGDMFIFPKGLVHFQYNTNQSGVAVAVSAFGSSNAGTISIPKTVFTAGIDETVLAKSFKASINDIKKLEYGLKPKA